MTIPGRKESMWVGPVSVRKLFDNTIVLRDLEPLNKEIPGLSTIKDRLSLPANYLPRKNEANYARVVEIFLKSLAADAKYVFYVGDSLFNDGNAIKHLARLGHFQVLGFLCCEEGLQMGEFLLGNFILSDNWSHLWKLVEQGIERGFEIGPRTVGLFDLDNTTYAAKGRASEPLTRARLEAAKSLLREVMGELRFNEEWVERAYREFDQDNYHRFTGDNLDYVVFLALVYSLGMLDISGIRKNLVESGIESFLERILSQIEGRKVQESMDEAWRLTREIYFNMRAGDKTPCKAFRSKEYVYTAKWMLGDRPGVDSPITITREVAELVLFLRNNGARVLALSDRPVEATSPWDLPDGTRSLLDISMEISGESISDLMESLTQV